MEHCGYLVRYRILISIHEWKQKINAPDVSFVSHLDKNLLWNDILQYFTLQADNYDGINDDELKELVRKWALKKIATQSRLGRKPYTTHMPRRT